MTNRAFPTALKYSAFLLVVACNSDDPTPEEIPGDGVFRLPVVVHVLHNGDAIGEGNNLSDARIIRQIEVLNDGYVL